MKKEHKNMLLGLSAIVLIGGISFLVSQEIKDTKIKQKEAKDRADNVYFDSLTEKDIAWG
tara:strand:+ start:6663 stop:6842 length:180 start_codon:yes stop_codon:yes gene_type:complete